MPDLKITQLTDLPIPAVGDELPIAADPLGTPVTRKTKVGNLTRQILDPTAKTANYTLTTSDRFITVDASGASRTVFVPAASGNTGIVWTVKKIDSSSNTVTIDPDASETIDGAANYVLTEENQAISFTSNGTNIVILFNKQETGAGGFISSVTDTAEILLTVSAGDLTADIEVDSIDQSKLEPGIRDLLTDADTALQLADLQTAPSATPTGSDLINFIDVSDGNALKTATISSLPGGGGGSQEVYIQDAEPSVSGPTIWVQTGLGRGGDKFMLWALDV
jgi:hypothetical protein